MIDQDDERDDTPIGEDQGNASASDIPLGTSSMKMSLPTSSSMDPTLQKYLQNKQDLAAAQSQARDNQMIAGLARAGATLSAGLARSNAPVNEQPFNALDQAAGQPVQDVLNKQKSEATDLSNQKAMQDVQKAAADKDPNSPQSQQFKATLKANFPTIAAAYGDKFDQLTAEDSSNVLKVAETKEKIDARKSSDVAKAADRQSAAADRADAKSTKDQNAALQNVNGLLESARGNPAAAQAERDIYAAQKANTLYEQTKGNPNPEMAKLYISEIGKIAQGGSPTVDELKGLTPGVLTGPMAKAWENLSGDPTPAGMQKFMAQYKAYADGVAKDAQRVIEDKYGRVIETNKDRLGDSNYQSLKRNYVDRFKSGAPGQASAAAAPSHSDIIGQALASRSKGAPSQAAIPLPNYSNPQTSPPGAIPPGIAAPQEAQNFAFGGTVQPPGFQHIRQQFTPHMSAPKATHMAKAPTMRMPTMDAPTTQAAHFAQGGMVNRCYACGGEVYAHGGQVPGQPMVDHNDPKNDVVDAKLTPKEVVLPLSVTQSKSPEIAAYLFMKNLRGARNG